MRRQNKVNPGMYTQRGRLTQDDAARELRKQSAFGSPHTWQPVNTRRPRLAPPGDAVDAEGSAAAETTKAPTAPRAKARPASRVTMNTVSKAAVAKARPKAAKSKTVISRKSRGAGTRSRTSKSTTVSTNARKTAAGARKQPTAKRRKR